MASTSHLPAEGAVVTSMTEPSTPVRSVARDSPIAVSSGIDQAEDAVVIDPTEAPSYSLGVIDVDELESGLDITPARPAASTNHPNVDADNIPDVFAEDTPIAGPSRRPRADVASDFAADVDPSSRWYAGAYSEAQLRTFHCEKVKKMPLASLDPSMLLGFW